MISGSEQNKSLHVQGTVNNPAAPPDGIDDQTIAANVVSALSHTDGIDVNNIRVEAKEGVVTLSGKLRNAAAYLLAHHAAAHTVGVTDVINDLIIEKSRI